MKSVGDADVALVCVAGVVGVVAVTGGGVMGGDEGEEGGSTQSVWVTASLVGGATRRTISDRCTSRKESTRTGDAAPDGGGEHVDVDEDAEVEEAEELDGVGE